MKLTKRIIALTISVLMLATLLPAGAFAIDVADSETVAAGIMDNLSEGFHIHMDFEGATTDTLSDYFADELAASEFTNTNGIGALTVETESDNSFARTDYINGGLTFKNSAKLTGQAITISFDFRVDEKDGLLPGADDVAYFPFVRFSSVDSTGGASPYFANPLMMKITGTREGHHPKNEEQTYMGGLGYTTEYNQGGYTKKVDVYTNLWYSVQLTYDPNTTRGWVRIEDAYGEETNFSVDCYSLSTVNLIAMFRGYPENGCCRVDFDNLKITSASSAELVQELSSDFNELVAGAKVSNSTFSSFFGYSPSGSYTSWVVADDGTGNKYLKRDTTSPKPFRLLTSAASLANKKIEISFDYLVESGATIVSSGILSLSTAAGSDNRIFSFQGTKLYLGKTSVYQISPAAVSPGEWNHFTVVVDPSTVDFEIYMNGELRVVTQLNPATGNHKVWTAVNGGWHTEEAPSSSTSYPFAISPSSIAGFYFFHTASYKAGLDNLRIRTFGTGDPTYINSGTLYDIASVGNVCCKDAYLNGGADMKAMSDSPLELSLNSNGYNHFENDAITIEGTIKATAGEATEPLVIAALNRYSGQGSVISTPLVKVAADGTVSAGVVPNLATVTLGEDIPFKLTISGISMLATLEIGGNTYAGIPFADAMQTLTAGGPSYATGRTVVTNSSAIVNEHNYYGGIKSLDTITLLDGEGWTTALTDLKVYVDKDADWYHMDFDTLAKVGASSFNALFSSYSNEAFYAYGNKMMQVKSDGWACLQSGSGGNFYVYDNLSNLVGKTFVIQSDFNYYHSNTAPSGVKTTDMVDGLYFSIVAWGNTSMVKTDNKGNLFLGDGTELNGDLEAATWETLAVALHPGALTASGYLYNYDVFLKNGESMDLLGSSSLTVPLSAAKINFAQSGVGRVTMGYDNLRIYGATAPNGATLDLAEDDISLDLSKSTVDFSYDLFGTAAIADGVLMTGEAGSFAWHDMVSLAKTNLEENGFTVEMKIKAAAPTEGTRVLLQLAADDISRDLLTIDAEGKIVISGSTGKYPVASLDATEYTAIQLAFVRDTEMIGVYADGKLLGNISYKTDLLLSELFALHFAEDVALSEFKVHSTLVRDYVDESGTIVEWDAEYYTDSGDNLSDGAAFGSVAADGVITSGNFTTKTSDGETFFRRSVENKNQTELFVTGSFAGEVAQIDVTFRNTTPVEGATTGSDVIRLRKDTGSDAYHLRLLSMEDSTGYIYLNNGSALYLCDEEGNRYSANTDWISVSIVYNSKMATVRYAVNGELAYYVKASDDGFTEPLKANALAMSESVAVHQSEAVEMRIRYYPGGSANTVDISHIRAYKIADQNGISTAQTYGAQIGKVKLDASGNITANTDEAVEEVNAIRFLAGVDTTLYTGIGFDFEMWDDTAKAWKATKTVNSSEVYTSVSAAGETVTARELGYRYIVAAAIIGVDSTAYIRVRPYANLGAGAKMYGDADVYLVTYDNGSVSVSKPIEGYAVYSESFEERNMSNYLRYDYNGNPITADVLNNNIYGFTTGGDYSAAVRVQRGDGYGGSSAMSILDAHRAANGGFSGRVKLMQILPDDLSAYEGATLRLSLKIKGSDFVTSQITEVDGGKEEVYTEATSATGAYGFMLADGYTSWGGKTYTLTQEGEWITVTTELTLTSTHLKTLKDGTTYDPICVYVQFGSSPFARDTFIDDVVVELITKDCELLK